MEILNLRSASVSQKNIQNNNISVPFWGLKMNNPLTADKVSFSSKPQIAITGYTPSLDTEYSSTDLRNQFGVKGSNLKKAVSNGDIEIASDLRGDYTISHTRGNPDITREGAFTFRIKNPNLQKYYKTPSTYDIEAAKCRYAFRRDHEDTATTEELEILGYGSKADIIANPGLREDNYYFKRYIQNNDEFELNTPAMRTALSITRAKNPALIPVSGNSKKMPVPLLFALINGKVRSVNDVAGLGDTCINIADKKNLDYLRTIDIPEFQKWIDEKLAAHSEYRAKNQRIYEIFKSSPEKADVEVKSEFKAQIEELNAKNKRKKGKFSLLMKAAWALSPNTKKVMGERFNPHIADIMKRSKISAQIQRDLMLGKITLKDAEDMLSKLNLTEDELHELHAYYKDCWETAGTGEWKKGLETARKIAAIYVEKGVDGFENETMREFVKRWEDDYNRKKLIFG